MGRFSSDCSPPSMLMASDDEPPSPDPAGAAQRVVSFSGRSGSKKRTHSATSGSFVPAGGWNEESHVSWIP